jgi:L-arabinose 1-dehydrogenase [NAD(P)+]
MKRVAVTGAAGTLGRQALLALDDHDVTAITHKDHEDIDGTVCDLADADGLVDAFSDHDVIVHLAANSNASSDWPSVLQTNINGTYNVYEAARKNHVDRVIFASSNHTTGMYNIADPTKRGTMRTDETTIVDPSDPPRPDSYYGVSKVAGEAMGSYYADRFGIEVINLRIGWFLTKDELLEEASKSSERERFARALWLSPLDWRDAVRSAVTTTVSDAVYTLHIISRNSDRYVTLTPTIQAIGYRPRDDAAQL